MSFSTDKIEMFTRRRIVIFRYCVKCGKKTVKTFMTPDNYATWEHYVFMTDVVPNIRCEFCGNKTMPMPRKEFEANFPFIPKEEVDRKYAPDMDKDEDADNYYEKEDDETF